MFENSTCFNKAQQFVLQWEGGLCEDANDAGGITKYGVCLRFLKSIKPDATREDIINLTKEEASQIFYTHFWKKCRCDELPERIAFALYDTAINVGVSQAVKLLQRSVCVKADGIIGDVTIQAVNRFVGEGEEDKRLTDFLIRRKAFYTNLAAQKPSQKVFLKGWLNRTSALAAAVSLSGKVATA